jgi:hypothetical protein
MSPWMLMKEREGSRPLKTFVGQKTLERSAIANMAFMTVLIIVLKQMYKSSSNPCTQSRSYSHLGNDLSHSSAYCGRYG